MHSAMFFLQRPTGVLGGNCDFGSTFERHFQLPLRKIGDRYA